MKTQEDADLPRETAPSDAGSTVASTAANEKANVTAPPSEAQNASPDSAATSSTAPATKEVGNAAATNAAAPAAAAAAVATAAKPEPQIAAAENAVPAPVAVPAAPEVPAAADTSAAPAAADSVVDTGVDTGTDTGTDTGDTGAGTDSAAASNVGSGDRQTAATAAAGGTRFVHIQESLALLCKYFPQAFIAEGNAKPLKIGIFKDLKTAIAGKEGLTLSKVRAALRLYTTRLKYFYCLKEGAMRVDLDGHEVEPVTAEHAAFALEKFNEINEKRKAALKNSRKKRPDSPGRKSAKGQNGHRGPAAGRPHPKKIVPNGVKATEADLTDGRSVMVITGGKRYVKASVAHKAEKGNVMVTLLNGTSLTVPIERVLLPAAHHHGNVKNQKQKPKKAPEKASAMVPEKPQNQDQNQSQEMTPQKPEAEK